MTPLMRLEKENDPPPYLREEHDRRFTANPDTKTNSRPETEDVKNKNV